MNLPRLDTTLQVGSCLTRFYARDGRDEAKWSCAEMDWPPPEPHLPNSPLHPPRPPAKIGVDFEESKPTSSYSLWGLVFIWGLALSWNGTCMKPLFRPAPLPSPGIGTWPSILAPCIESRSVMKHRQQTTDNRQQTNTFMRLVLAMMVSTGAEMQASYRCVGPVSTSDLAPTC